MFKRNGTEFIHSELIDSKNSCHLNRNGHRYYIHLLCNLQCSLQVDSLSNNNQLVEKERKIVCKMQKIMRHNRNEKKGLHLRNRSLAWVVEAIPAIKISAIEIDSTLKLILNLSLIILMGFDVVIDLHFIDKHLFELIYLFIRQLESCNRFSGWSILMNYSLRYVTLLSLHPKVFCSW